MKTFKEIENIVFHNLNLVSGPYEAKAVLALREIHNKFVNRKISKDEATEQKLEIKAKYERYNYDTEILRAVEEMIAFIEFDLVGTEKSAEQLLKHNEIINNMAIKKQSEAFKYIALGLVEYGEGKLKP